MLVVAPHVLLPELGQVWGNPDTFSTFKRTILAQYAHHWEPLCNWFQNATRDRGFLLEIPEAEALQGLLAGEAQLFSLTIVFGNHEAVEAQMRLGLESFMHGGLLIEMGERLDLSTHT